MRTIGHAMHAERGWGTIADRPDWGQFKSGHTHPDQSNSGRVTLILMAYESLHKRAGLGGLDVHSPKFEKFLIDFERGVTGLSHSTADMMKEMILKGPSAFDALMVYESVAIDFLPVAEGRWDDLQIVYPEYNLWNDNPYYILNTPWTTPAHQQAADAFFEVFDESAGSSPGAGPRFSAGQPDGRGHRPAEPLHALRAERAEGGDSRGVRASVSRRSGQPDANLVAQCRGPLIGGKGPQRNGKHRKLPGRHRRRDAALPDVPPLLGAESGPARPPHPLSRLRGSACGVSPAGGRGTVASHGRLR